MSFIWRCTMNFFNTTNGTFAQNVIYMEDESELKTPDQIGALLDDNWWGATSGNPNLRNATSTNVRLETILFQRVFPLPPLGSTPYTTLLRAGGVGSAVKHAVLGIVFTIKDGQAGRAHRGRVYHYGVPGVLVTDAGPTPGNLVSTFNPIAAAWVDRFQTGGTSGLIWNIFHRGASNGGMFTRVASISVNPRLCVQRRRNFGVGI